MIPRCKTHPAKTLGWGTLPSLYIFCYAVLLGVRNGYEKKFQCETNSLEPGGEQGAGLDYGGVTFGAGGDHADFDLEEVGYKF